eukprot:1836400-Pleurochrysis_carterae.AAC.2
MVLIADRLSPTFAREEWRESVKALSAEVAKLEGRGTQQRGGHRRRAAHAAAANDAAHADADADGSGTLSAEQVDRLIQLLEQLMQAIKW